MRVTCYIVCCGVIRNFHTAQIQVRIQKILCVTTKVQRKLVLKGHVQLKELTGENNVIVY